MNEVNKTLYIPLYGKALVSQKGIILHDPKAEMIWEKEGFPLKGKAKSKWLAYYMGMRSAVFDKWVRNKLGEYPDAIVLHIGCGMDSRVERIGAGNIKWYDIDFPEVIVERKKYYSEVAMESCEYHMLTADARRTEWIETLPQTQNAIIIMEGVSMYLKTDELIQLLQALKTHFCRIHILMDCYTEFAAKASKYKNPINEVGASIVYGLDDPMCIERQTDLHFLEEKSMTPSEMINELQGFEKSFFKCMLGGRMAMKLYRLYEFG